MANTLLAINGRSSLSVDDSLEVYVDINTSSAPNSSMLRWPVLSGDFLAAAETGLSAVFLSCQAEDTGEVRPVVADDGVPATGADALQKYVERFGEIALTADEDRFPDVMYAALSGGGQFFGDGDAFDPATQAALSACCVDSLTAAEGAVDARQYEWRRRVSDLVNVNAVKNSIRQIFTWVPGERIINPEFGSRLRLYLYEPITDENQERIVAEIKAAVLRWEPRASVDRVVKVTDVSDIEENTVRLDIYYTIKGLNDKQFKYEYEYSRAKYSKM